MATFPKCTLTCLITIIDFVNFVMHADELILFLLRCHWFPGRSNQCWSLLYFYRNTWDSQLQLLFNYTTFLASVNRVAVFPDALFQLSSHKSRHKHLQSDIKRINIESLSSSQLDFKRGHDLWYAWSYSTELPSYCIQCRLVWWFIWGQPSQMALHNAA